MKLFNYLNKSIRDHLILIIFAFFFVGLFQYLILTLVIKLDILTLARSFMQRLPMQAQQLFSDQFLAGFTIQGAAAFGFNHPLVLTMLVIVAIQLPSRHIAGEIESGTLELLLSQPVPRSLIFYGSWLTSVISLFIIITGSVAGTFMGYILYEQARVIPIKMILLIAFNLWLLMISISSIALFSSVWNHESGRAALQTGGLILLFYFLNYIVSLWPAIDYLRFFTLFNYNQPQTIMASREFPATNALILAAVVLVFSFLAKHRLSNRDVPG